MRLIDVHCHLESEYFRGNISETVSRAARAGVEKIITNSICPDGWQLSRSIAAAHQEVEFALGIHPWYIKDDHYESLDEMPSMLESGAIAVGEIGLDRRIEYPPFDLQVKFFARQLGIAKEMNLPVIVHCRSAFDDLAGIVRKQGLPESGGVIHAFSGSMETAAEMIQLGFSFSVGGAMTWRLSNKRKGGIKFIYPDYFLLETDSPDFLPIGLMGNYNEPANLILNLRAASVILGEDETSIAEISTRNAERIFKFS